LRFRRKSGHGFRKNCKGFKGLFLGSDGNVEVIVSSLDWLCGALKELDEKGLRRTLSERGGPQRARGVCLDGRELVNFGSNDYLGLAADERVCEAARGAIEKYGWGAGASPLVTGRTDLHGELERRLAEFEGTEAALVFPSGYAANVGTITALVGTGDVIFSDELNHASIIDGCRLSGATVHVYRHLDTDHLDAVVTHLRGKRRNLIVTDSLFSMGGDVAPLAELARLANYWRAMLLVDEAHATGVLGEQGRGVCELAGVDSKSVIKVGTLSKALGSIGGFVAGSRLLIEWLANRARPYVFSTAMPAAAAAAALQVIDMVREEPQRRRRVLALAGELGRQLVSAGILKSLPQSQIVPVVLGDPQRTMAASRELRQRGFFVPGIRPPSVPQGRSLLRISLTSEHTQEDVERLVGALADVAR
jgi:8-amino-7-oxononanoate synthase